MSEATKNDFLAEKFFNPTTDFEKWYFKGSEDGDGSSGVGDINWDHTFIKSKSESNFICANRVKSGSARDLSEFEKVGSSSLNFFKASFQTIGREWEGLSGGRAQRDYVICLARTNVEITVNLTKTQIFWTEISSVFSQNLIHLQTGR